MRRDSVAREALVARHSRWARQVARSVYRRLYGFAGIWEDCAQNALLGLIESIDRFDPSRGIEFELYAKLRVRGSVFNGLRAMRNHQGKHETAEGAIRTTRERVESMQDGDDTDPLEAFVHTAIGLGLGVLLDAQSMPSGDQSDAYAFAEASQRSELVSECVKLLPERERLLLTLHYYHHVPFVEIAIRMCVTKGRVSQLHKQALDRLRQMLREHWSEFA